ncbi:MAG TPA: glycosyltransferase [Xanthomonadaceae bacterium]|nr:glycosyltransferase [Xanthomonadaceae bacterium]
MPTSLAELRFLSDRGLGLVRRGLASLRTRGVRASWRRMSLHLFPPARDPAEPPLYSPGAPAAAPANVPASPSPRASIVIPVHGERAHTLACLHALAAHPPMAACEVIVVDDASPDDTADALSGVAGLRLHRRATNGGFIAACNDGAAIARGTHLVFLNNDTVPQPGWLDALLATFEAHPQAGLVGAQLLYPDGRLQEAGGVVFNDGSAWNYGRFESRDDPRFAFVRDADYCSGAALAIPRQLFLQLDGFDPRYAPAYYEDTDLAFKVRKAGRRVLYQPAARVVHVEGATAGTDPGRGAKAYQARNQVLFAEHWTDALARLPPRAAPDAHTVAGNRPQVLIIDALTPAADRDSGSLRLVNLMRLLIEEGAHVVFLPSNRMHAGPDTVALQQSGVECWHAPWAGRAPHWLREHGARFDTVLVSRHYVAREFLPLLRRHAPRARVIFDTVDLHYLRERRGAELAGDDAWLRTASRTRALELDVVTRADTTLVVSPVEQAVLREDAAGARVEVLSNLHQLAGTGLPFEQRRDLVFVGGFRHPPNVDAVCWFVQEVFPRVRQRLPGVVFHCIGGDVPAVVSALGAQPGVEVHGHVPDIEPYMAGCRVAIAPLRYGAGVKGKVNLSMAHGQPVVATSCAVEGMFLRAGEDVLVADDAAGFAEAVVRVHEDPVLWGSLARNGRESVARHFSFDAARETVRRVFLP